VLDQAREVDPALAGVPDGAGRGNGGGVEPGCTRGDLFGAEQVAVVAVGQLVRVALFEQVGPVLRLPGQTAVEVQPVRIGVLGGQRPVAVDADI
jgi:hypothetical protein